ncbi:MAG: SAM-dependent methyltransferase [Acidobacteria bacterium]|nr:MAG: SAM-dependent methyltransferase [Acidobacteriota bacterium]
MASSFINNNLHQAKSDQSQPSVDAFFRARSGYWRDVYQEDNNSFLPSYFRERRSLVLALIDRLGLPERANILEVGCGAGLTAIAMAKRGYAVDAVDTVEAMLDLTRQAARDAGVDGLVKTILGSVIETNLPPQRFELAAAAGVLPWLDHPAEALREINRVLKPSGHVVLTAANRWCLNRMTDPVRLPGLREARQKVEDALKKRNLLTLSQPRFHEHSIRQIDELLLRTGFRKVHGMTIGFGPFTFFNQRLLSDRLGIKVHRRLQALADRQFPGLRSGGIEYVVVAAKPA